MNEKKTQSNIKQIESVYLETRMGKSGKPYNVIVLRFQNSDFEYCLFPDFRMKR